jgi:hypothetical protein
LRIAGEFETDSVNFDTMPGYRFESPQMIRKTRKRTRPARKIIALALLTALPAIAAEMTEKDYAVTVYAGYRGGGSFTDADTQQSLTIDASGAVSFALDLPLDASRQYQIFVSHQRTHLSLDSTSFAGGNRLAMDITYLHIGGTNFYDGAVGRGPYFVGGLGATLFNPASGYSSELYPSINIGFGYQWPLGDKLAARVEARGYATLVNSSGGVFCSGGCVISIKGDTVTQGEVMLGLSSRF